MLADYQGARDETSVLAIFAQTLCGVQALHDRGIVHCDLKPQNFLFVRNQSAVPFVKLADLGSAQRLDSANSPTHEGTLSFLSPECILGAPATFSSDVWGLGCILYTLCEGRPPFEGPIGPLVAAISTANYKPLCQGLFSVELISLVDKMLAVSPSQRITIPEMLTSSLIDRSLQFLSTLYEAQASHL
jgi:serine/threonine protein kinase